MNKTELIENVAERANSSKGEAQKYVERPDREISFQCSSASFVAWSG